MPEAVFSISANITPQIDERELENQAQVLANKLNGILSKNVDKVGIRGDTRSFQEVQTQLTKASRATQILQKTLGQVPRVIGNVGQAARSTFLKFTDAINLTRRGIVGFGGSILDMIKRTNLFEGALENLRGTGDAFTDLPGTFQVLAAQVRSGTSMLDQAAQAGDRFAQGILPITRFSEASLEAIVKLSEEVENLGINIVNMGKEGAKGLGGLRSTAGTINKGFKQVLKTTQNLGTFLEPGTQLFADFSADIKEASSVEELVGSMVNLKNATERVSGPLGLVRQLIGTLSKEERQAAQDLERRLKKALLEIDPSQLTGFERLTTRVRNFGDSVVSTVRTVNEARRIIADFIPGENIGVSAAKFGTFFKELKAEGLSTTDALRQAFAKVFQASSFGLFFNKVRRGFIEMVTNAAFASKFIKDDLTKAFNKIKTFSIGDTVNNISDRFNSFVASVRNFSLGDAIGNGVNKASDKINEFTAKARTAIANLARGSEAQRAAAALAATKAAEVAATKARAAALAKAAAEDASRPAIRVQQAATEKHIILPKAGPKLTPRPAVFDVTEEVQATVSAVNKILEKGRDQLTGRTGTHGILDLMGIDVTKGAALDEVINDANKKVGVLRGGINKLKGSDNGGLRALGAGFNAVGAAAKLALGPVRLVNQAAGKALQVGLQLSTAALKVGGAAMAGFVGTAIATGVQFNSLQAIIRSTLPVILGSADASEKLLKEINALNDESPFARSSFLELTRVLAGFGVEAEKITPLIDAIQQAVAATGGGEGDLLELGQAFARLQSQGRLSLDIIQSFSSRGIDVISILGQEFGKTQGEVRDMISDGLVPAGKAIDALTKGLKGKFDGATDAVSKNLPGALDRVKAKTRDFGAELTRAFINPEGGGAVVDLLNSFATVVNVITKQFLPLLRPALEGVANQITNMSKKAADFAKTMGSFEAGKLKEFAGGLDGLLGPLAALTALMPILLQSVPFIGPLFAGLASGIPGVTLAVTAFLLTLKPVRDGLKEFGKSVAPVGATLLPKIAAAFKALGNAVGPIVGKILAALGPIVAQVGATFGELADQMVPIFEQLQRLFVALEPVIDIIKNGYIAAWKTVQMLFIAFLPIAERVIEVMANFAERAKPGLEAIAEFTDRIHLTDVDDGFDRLAGPITRASDALVTLKDNAKGFVDSLPVGGGLLKGLGERFVVKPFKFFTRPLTAKELSPAEKAVKDLTEKIKTQATEMDETADSIHDGYNKAKKAAEDAEKKVGQLTDQVKQQMSAYQSMLDPLIEAQKAVEAAQAAQKDASQKAKDAAQNVTDVIKEQAKALRDVIAPTDELAVAQRNLVRTQNELRDLGREEVDLQKELADLRGDTATDERAALDRALERAKIALNKAQKEQNELLNEGNKAEKTNLDLTGLTVDQIKTRLSTVRASLKAQKDTKEPVSTQDKADEKTSAALDVADATQAVKDAGKARAQFEVDNARKIRDNEERIIAIGADKADMLLDEAGQLNHIADLRAGETAQLGVIKDFEEKIKNAKDANAAAQKAVTDAVMATQLATLNLQHKNAEINGDYDEMFRIQGLINGLKSTGLGLTTQTETSLRAQADLVKQTLEDLREANRLQKIANDTKRVESIKDLGQRSSQRDFLWQSVQDSLLKKVPLDEETLKGIKDAQQAMKDAFTAVNANAGILNSQDQPVILTAAQLENILLSVSEDMVTHPKMSILEILRAILAHMGLHIPTAASGYAPGLHRGLNDGRGLMRMFEYGQEAVLPLTRKLDMYRIVNNPSVLPKILEALPKVLLPTNTADTGSLSPFQRLAQPPGVGEVGLGSISRTSGRRGQAAAVSTDAARRKEQREFAGSVGEAVKVAMKEALSESGGALGSDIDINVGSSSDNDVMIAREVKRQIERALGRW